MTAFRIGEAARLIGVSDDTIRRWIESGRLTTMIGSRPLTIEGAELARFVAGQAEQAGPVDPGPIVGHSARNRLTGLVTKVVEGPVMTQVVIQAGPFRIVSLISTEAALELGLAPGTLAVASVQSTNVAIQIPGRS